MNISTPTTTTDTTQNQSNTKEIQQTQNVEKNTDVNKTEEKKNENKEQQSDFKKMLDEAQASEKTNLEQLESTPQNQQQVDQQFVNKFSFDTIQSLKNLQSNYNYDTVKISKDDAKFFIDLVENKQYVLQQNGENQNLIKFTDEIGPTYKSEQTSKVLADLITKAYNEQKPVRIDFDNNVSVVIKIDSKGKISAEFIPGDKAVEAYLRNNIGFLKQRFDDQNISYNDILYRQSNNGNQNKERQNQQKDKGE